MEFIVDQDKLAKSIAVVSRLASSKGISQVTRSSLKFKLNQNQLSILATDIEMTIETTLEVKSKDTGVFVISVKPLADIVRLLAEGTITFEYKHSTVSLKAGSSEIELPTFSPDSFQAKIWPSEKGVEIPVKEFKDAITKVVKIASTDEIRPVLTGVLFEETAKGIRLVATDSYRLAICDLDGLKVFNSNKNVLIPAKALSEVERAISQAGGSEKINVLLTDDCARFEVDNITIWTQLITEEFPDYNKLIPTSSEFKILVSKERIINSLNMMRALLSDKVSSVRFKPTEDTLEISVNVPDSAQGRDIIQIESKGTPVEVAFNPSYLIEGISFCPSENIVIDISDVSQPALVRADNDLNYQYLLMPIKTVS